MVGKNAYCSFCGSAFETESPFPRTCAHCANITYANPLPVAVLLLPVDGGVLCIRRGIEPRRGKLALPGGFIEVGESWQAAAAREVREEARVMVQPEEIRLYDARSAQDGTLLVFGITADKILPLPPFEPTEEAAERVLIHEPVELAFPLHTAVVRRFFEERLQRSA